VRTCRFLCDSVGRTGKTIQFMANVFSSTLGCRHPMAIRPRWIMSDVLVMPAIEFGYPIQIIIQMKSNNFSGSALQLSLRLHDLLFGRTIPF
jgi:hypothetical protein